MIRGDLNARVTRARDRVLDALDDVRLDERDLYVLLSALADDLELRKSEIEYARWRRRRAWRSR